MAKQRLGAHYGWVLIGWTSKDSAYFADANGRSFDVSGPILDALLSHRPDIAQ